MRVWVALGLLVVIVLTINFATARFSDNSCPKDVYGSNNSTKIAYFSSPLCVACWAQKPIIKKLAAEHGDKFVIEEYDVDLCRDAAAPHYIRGVPAFIVDDKVYYGLRSEEILKEMII